MGAIRDWGKTADGVGAWVDRVKDKFDRRVKVKGGFGGDGPMSLTGAFDRGSADAYKLTTNYGVMNSGLNPDSPERQQVELAKRQVMLTQQLIATIAGMQVLKVVG